MNDIDATAETVEKEEVKSDFEFYGCRLHRSLVDKNYCVDGCQRKNPIVKSLATLSSGNCPYRFSEEDYYAEYHNK